MTTTIIPQREAAVNGARRMTLAERAQLALSAEQSDLSEFGQGSRRLGEIARRKAMELLGVKPQEIRDGASPRYILVDGVTLTADLDLERSHGADHNVFCLKVEYPCPHCGQRQVRSAPVRDLADLARVLDWQKNDWCRECW